MTRLIKGVLLTLGLVLCSLLLYVANEYRNLKLQSAAADRVRAGLEVRYQSQVEEYRNALKIGTPRSDVTKYLQSRNIQYGDDRNNLEVNLGREPDVGTCNYWTVYVSFEFTREDLPSPDDRLVGISLKKIGHCL